MRKQTIGLKRGYSIIVEAILGRKRNNVRHNRHITRLNSYIVRCVLEQAKEVFLKWYIPLFFDGKKTLPFQFLKLKSVSEKRWSSATKPYIFHIHWFIGYNIQKFFRRKKTLQINNPFSVNNNSFLKLKLCRI